MERRSQIQVRTSPNVGLPRPSRFKSFGCGIGIAKTSASGSTRARRPRLSEKLAHSIVHFSKSALIAVFRRQSSSPAERWFECPFRSFVAQPVGDSASASTVNFANSPVSSSPSNPMASGTGTLRTAVARSTNVLQPSRPGLVGVTVGFHATYQASPRSR